MANDRIFIVCKTCGGWKMLMKFFPGSLATRDNKILQWLDSHGECHPNLYKMELEGDPGFHLVTENDSNRKELDWKKQNKLREEMIKEGLIEDG